MSKITVMIDTNVRGAGIREFWRRKKVSLGEKSKSSLTRPMVVEACRSTRGWRTPDAAKGAVLTCQHTAIDRKPQKELDMHVVRTGV